MDEKLNFLHNSTFMCNDGVIAITPSFSQLKPLQGLLEVALLYKLDPSVFFQKYSPETYRNLYICRTSHQHQHSST
jgi:hypothetical protein